VSVAEQTLSVARAPSARDLVALTKPGITLMSVIVAGGALALASVARGIPVDVASAIGLLVGVGASVAGASAMNMAAERELDKKMARTKNRPLPSGRMAPSWAWGAGVVLTLVSLPLVYLCGSSTSLVVTVAATIGYVAVYTPMKQKSAWSLLVGALPGAAPALQGYAALDGVVDENGLALFLFAFFWQLPHFLAITLYRAHEYENAGHVVWAATFGPRPTRALITSSTVPLVLSSAWLATSDVVGALYGTAAVFLALYFVGAMWARDESHERFGRRVFKASLVYQTLLFAALALDVVWRMHS
jgi:protoheme IX farnesyltransferase